MYFASLSPDRGSFVLQNGQGLARSERMFGGAARLQAVWRRRSTASNALRRHAIRFIDGGAGRSVARMVVAIAAVAATFSAAACPPGHALTVLVPYPAGGSVDVTTRIVAHSVSMTLKQPVNIANVPGASGLLAVRKLLSAEHDGCTLLAATINTVVLLPLLNAHAAFTTEQLQPLVKTGATTRLLVASKASGISDMAALRQAARPDSTPLRAGHPGHESLQAVTLQLLERKLGRPMIEVPYNGGAQLVNDLLGGHLDIAVLANPVALPLVRRGALTLLTALSADDGYPGESWSGWFVAHGVGPSDVQAVTSALHAAMIEATTVDALNALGVLATPSPEGQTFAQEVAATSMRLREALIAPGRP